eukprot:482620-Pyramimonas_sp.AAC.1
MSTRWHAVKRLRASDRVGQRARHDEEIVPIAAAGRNSRVDNDAPCLLAPAAGSKGAGVHVPLL